MLWLIILTSEAMATSLLDLQRESGIHYEFVINLHSTMMTMDLSVAASYSCSCWITLGLQYMPINTPLLSLINFPSVGKKRPITKITFHRGFRLNLAIEAHLKFRDLWWMLWLWIVVVIQRELLICSGCRAGLLSVSWPCQCFIFRCGLYLPECPCLRTINQIR